MHACMHTYMHTCLHAQNSTDGLYKPYMRQCLHPCMHASMPAWMRPSHVCACLSSTLSHQHVYAQLFDSTCAPMHSPSHTYVLRIDRPKNGTFTYTHTSKRNGLPEPTQFRAKGRLSCDPGYPEIACPERSYKLIAQNRQPNPPC